ncbi:DUF624 domain-containing protein [Streptomyces sp. TS71-3]|uniref:DUF624 domain-containing protein n=1 Tax=Streptomyces sp. TS71-3 TaxID=2733862 RepID=UPI001B1E660E|nr:DUF624 domain-containing protein [Streptomyces sp. TS71-3]GHJ41557.1 hypothetical protein Sm713_71660 [Streptomyces sp. TS71-3]
MSRVTGTGARAGTTGGHTPAASGTGRRAVVALGPERAEQVRMAAEAMAVGVLFALFSLPLVTAGAAWCAAAEVTAGWHQGREPALLRTFARTVRRDLLAGLVLEATVLALAAATWFEVRLVLASRLPGYPVEAAALALLGACAVAFVLLTVACRAAQGPVPGAGAWGAAVRTAVRQARLAPTTLVLVVAGCACVAALVAVIPAFAGFMAGPLAYAVSVVTARNRGEGSGGGAR